MHKVVLTILEKAGPLIFSGVLSAAADNIKEKFKEKALDEMIAKKVAEEVARQLHKS